MQGRYHALQRNEQCFCAAKVLSRPCLTWVRTDKTHCERNESGYPSIADMRADIDWRRLVPKGDIHQTDPTLTQRSQTV
jgi:hypothetical protein